MHIYAGQIPVIAEEAKDPSHILGYAAIRGFEHQYIQWFIIYCPHTHTHTHTHILAVSTITNTFIQQQCTVLKEEEAEIGITIKGVTVIYMCSVYETYS